MGLLAANRALDDDKRGVKICRICIGYQDVHPDALAWDSWQSTSPVCFSE